MKNLFFIFKSVWQNFFLYSYVSYVSYKGVSDGKYGDENHLNIENNKNYKKKNFKNGIRFKIYLTI